jgi:Na+/H+ antiporter NhaA
LSSNGVGFLGGIGFTMSIFYYASRTSSDAEHIDYSKIMILDFVALLQECLDIFLSKICA